jgi:hypothetical protein
MNNSVVGVLVRVMLTVYASSAIDSLCRLRREHGISIPRHP